MSNNETKLIATGNKSLHDRQIKFGVPVSGVCREKEESARREREVALNAFIGEETFSPRDSRLAKKPLLEDRFVFYLFICLSKQCH